MISKIIFVFLAVSCLSLYGYTYEDKIFEQYKVDIYAKSSRGWLRVFNSSDRTKEYFPDITEDNRNKLVLFFKSKVDKNSEKYKREIR